MKNNNWFYLLIVCTSFFGHAANSQVVYRDLLSKNHKGELTQSINYPEKKLGYEWLFIDMEKGQFFAEGEAIQKINYKLIIKVDDKPVGQFDVQIRDLIVSHYIEIKAVKENEPRTITNLYNKSNRSLRIKGVLHEGCHRDGKHWERLNEVKSYQQLLNHIVMQLDKNVKLDCYF